MNLKTKIKIAKKNGTLGKLRGDLVNAEIRKQYSVSEELAILRQKDEKPEEYEEYNVYAEACKKMVADILAEIGGNG